MVEEADMGPESAKGTNVPKDMRDTVASEDALKVGLENMGEVKIAKDTDMEEAEIENKNECEEKIEKRNEGIGEAEVEKDTGEAEVEKDMDEAKFRKDMGEAVAEEDTCETVVEKDEGMGEAEVENRNENGLNPVEEDINVDGKIDLGLEMKDQEEYKIEEKHVSKDSDMVEENMNEEKEEVKAQLSEEGKILSDEKNNEEKEEDEVQVAMEEERWAEEKINDGKEEAEAQVGMEEERPTQEKINEKKEKAVAQVGTEEERPAGEKVNEEKEAEAQSSLEGKRSRKRSFKGQTKDEAKDPISPANLHIERPVRERKSVERLVAAIDKEPVKEFLIPKGHGTALKDIPAVAQNLSRKKNEETFKMLHVILFGRRGKATQVKHNLSQFSGFAWHENEEKQRLKMKEKLEKYVKEKLLEFCDVFDVPVLKATAKKEDILSKLIDFLATPRPTSNVLLGEKEKLGTSTKRDRIVKGSLPESGGTEQKHSSRKDRKTDGSPKMVEEHESESDNEFDRSEPDDAFLKGEDEETERSVSDGSEDKHSERKGKESESGEDSEVQTKKENASSNKLSSKSTLHVQNESEKITTAKKDSPLNSPKNQPTLKRCKDQDRKEKYAGREKNVTDGSEVERPEHSESMGAERDSKQHEEEKTTSLMKSKPQKVTPEKKETSVISPKLIPAPSKINDSSDKKQVVFSRKRKSQETSTVNSSAPSKSISTLKEHDTKEQSGKKSVTKKNESMKEKDAITPSEQELRKAICEILTEVDLNKATFLDILKQLGEHFKTDLAPRKLDIKVMVKEELIKLNDEDDEGDESDTEKEDIPEPAPTPAARETKLPTGKQGSSANQGERCRRSDGKKWRCSKDVAPGEKYCEHHLHRGRKQLKS